MQKFLFTVGQGSVHKRLDLYLSEQSLPLTRSQIKKLIDSSQVTVNHFQEKPSYRVTQGDIVEVQLEPPREPTVAAEAIPLDILFEDDDIIVLNKASGMVVHPAAGNYSGTLVNALLYHYNFLSGIGGVQRPGIVHRLDKGTSGVMVVAKNDHSHQNLSRQFKQRSVKKIYSALVYGEVKQDEGTIEHEIGRHLTDRKKMSTSTHRGREAVTHWKVNKRYHSLSLLEVYIRTGRTHQIRVHLATFNHPVVGDKLYGGKRADAVLKDERVKQLIKSLNRPFLHAHLLGLYHPRTQDYRQYRAPLPAELSEILSLLEDETC
jgi:23S rRNA pseudouridine1911/1915/1917 synthase